MRKFFEKIRLWLVPRDLIRCVVGYDEDNDLWKVVYGYSVDECKEKINRHLFVYESEKGFDVGLMSDSDCDSKYVYTIVDDTPGLYKSIEELESETLKIW